MGVGNIIKSVVTLPFKIILLPTKLFKKKEDDTAYPNQSQYQQSQTNYTPQSRYPNQQTNYPNNDNTNARVDLMAAQMDSLKIEYEAINQRIANIERMVKEIYAMAKS